MDVQVGPRTEMTEDRSDQGPKWMHTITFITTAFINTAASIAILGSKHFEPLDLYLYITWYLIVSPTLSYSDVM